MAATSKSIFVKLAISLLIASIALEIGGRLFLGDAIISPPSTVESYFQALTPHDSDRPLQPKPVFAPKRGFRFVVVGDSTAVGFPYAPGLSFGAFLAMGLTEALGVPCEWEIVGIQGRSSEGVVADLATAFEAQPDCLLIYIGHNEFAQRIANLSPFGRTLRRPWESLLPGFGNILWRISHPALPLDPSSEPPMFQSELKHGYRLLQYGNTESRPSGRLPLWPREREIHAERYEKNVATMVDEAKKRGIPCVAIEPVSNLLSAPLASGRRFDPRAQDAYDAGIALLTKDRGAARAKLMEARDLDAAPIRYNSALAPRLAAAAGDRLIGRLDANDIESRYIDMVHPTPELAALFAERIALQLPAGVPRLDRASSGQLQRFRTACARQIARAECREIIQNGNDGGTLLWAHMHLEYGNPRASENIIIKIPPARRSFAMVIILDLALRWRGGLSEARLQLEAAAEAHPEWKAGLDWWKERLLGR
jgi:lysophospholipase L1-like esterase